MRWLCEDELGRVVSFADYGPGQPVRAFLPIPEELQKPHTELDQTKITVDLVNRIESAKTEAAAAEIASAAVILGESPKTDAQAPA